MAGGSSRLRTFSFAAFNVSPAPSAVRCRRRSEPTAPDTRPTVESSEGVVVQRWMAGLGVVIAVAAACGEAPSENATDPAPQPPTEQRSATEGEDLLIDSQATLPREPASEFADIATTAADARVVWERFHLAGQPPQVDFETAALLVVGFGESGSCPARFDGLTVNGNRVQVAVGTEGGSPCDDDYNPRTFVLEVAKAALPDGGFEVEVSSRTFVLSSVPLSEPPPNDDGTGERLTGERTQLDFDAQPRSVSAGGRVELVLANDGDVRALTGSWPMVLHRWHEQRWLPADGDQDSEESSRSIIEEQTLAVEPGHQQVVAHIDTEGLDPGWYSVYSKLQLGGRGGAAEVHDRFEVDGQ